MSNLRETHVAFDHELVVYDEALLIPRTYSQCFRDAKHNFTLAATEWVEDRLPAFPFLDSQLTRQKIIDGATRNIRTFDHDIITDTFYKLAPHLVKTAGIAFWSEGIKEFQEAKVAAVRQELGAAAASLETANIISPDKMAIIGDIFILRERIRHKFRADKIPMVVIEDKMSNMINLVFKTYLGISFNISENQFDTRNMILMDF